jgi:hypothetical protein
VRQKEHPARINLAGCFFVAFAKTARADREALT